MTCCAMRRLGKHRLTTDPECRACAVNGLESRTLTVLANQDTLLAAYLIGGWSAIHPEMIGEDWLRSHLAMNQAAQDMVAEQLRQDDLIAKALGPGDDE